MLKTAIFLMGACGTLAAAAAVEKESIDAAKIRRIRLRDTAGIVRFIGDAEGKIAIESEKIEFGPNCTKQVKAEGSELTIVVEEKSLFEKTSCRVNFTLHVPAGAEIFAKLGAGSLGFQKTAGALDFKVGAADVEISGGTVPQLDGVLGSAKLDAQGLVGSASVKSGTGAVHLTYAKAPTAGVLDLKVGSGNIRLDFPKDSAFSTNYTAGSGHLTNEFEERPDAVFKIQVKAGSGDLRISKLKP